MSGIAIPVNISNSNSPLDNFEYIPDDRDTSGGKDRNEEAASVKSQNVRLHVFIKIKNARELFVRGHNKKGLTESAYMRRRWFRSLAVKHACIFCCCFFKWMNGKVAKNVGKKIKEKLEEKGIESNYAIRATDYSCDIVIVLRHVPRMVQLLAKDWIGKKIGSALEKNGVVFDLQSVRRESAFVHWRTAGEAMRWAEASGISGSVDDDNYFGRGGQRAFRKKKKGLKKWLKKKFGKSKVSRMNGVELGSRTVNLSSTDSAVMSTASTGSTFSEYSTNSAMIGADESKITYATGESGLEVTDVSTGKVKKKKGFKRWLKKQVSKVKTNRKRDNEWKSTGSSPDSDLEMEKQQEEAWTAAIKEELDLDDDLDFVDDSAFASRLAHAEEDLDKYDLENVDFGAIAEDSKAWQNTITP
eukprot:g5488.t1